MDPSLTREELVLEEVREDQFGDVRRALEHYLPYSIHVQSSVAVTKHYGLAGIIGRKVFTPRHPDYRYKMVVVTPVTTKREVQSLQLIWSLSEMSDENVYSLLRSLPGFSWTQSFIVLHLPELLHDQLSMVLARLSGHRLQSSFVTKIEIYTYEGPVPEPPISPDPEYMVSRIRQSDYDLLFTQLASSTFEDPTVMKKVFDRLPLVGVYKMSSAINDDGRTGTGASMETRGKGTDEKEYIPLETLPNVIEHPAVESHADRMEHSKVKKHAGMEHTVVENFNDAMECPKIDALSAGTEQPVIEALSCSGGQSSMKLVSWVMGKHTGDLGNTFTIEEFRGKGLAKMATLHCMKQREVEGNQLCAGVQFDNEISKKLLTKIGFTFQFVTYILRYTE